MSKQNTLTTIKCYRTNSADQVNYFLGVTLSNGHFFAFFMSDKGMYLNPISREIWGKMKREAETNEKELIALTPEFEKKAIEFAIKTESAIRKGYSPKEYILNPKACVGNNFVNKAKEQAGKTRNANNKLDYFVKK